MEKRFSLTDFLSQVFMLFGITVVVLSGTVLIFGDSARDFSAIFRFGSEGISVAVLMEFLLLITAAAAVRAVFMTDILIKRMPLAVRMICMFGAIFGAALGCIAAFGWFPINDTRSWIMFIVCFTVSCAVSTIVSAVREKNENKQLSDALNKVKAEL